MTLYRFSLSSLLVALVAFQNTYASINLDDNQILKAVIEEYCNTICCKEEQKKAKKQLDEEIKTAIAAYPVESATTQFVAFPQYHPFVAPALFLLPDFQGYNWQRMSLQDANTCRTQDNAAARSIDIRSQIYRENLRLRI